MIVAWFSEIREQDIGLAGGKGANLGEMTRAGLPVPKGFSITAETYRRIISTANLWPFIQAELNLQTHENATDTEAAAKPVGCSWPWPTAAKLKCRCRKCSGATTLAVWWTVLAFTGCSTVHPRPEPKPQAPRSGMLRTTVISTPVADPTERDGPAGFASVLRHSLDLRLCLPALLALGACASPPPVADEAATSATAPQQWQAPLPHGGQLGDLSRWWQQFDDPLLTQLIEAAQAVSPTLAAAQSRIAQARAAQVNAGAALGPTLDANASASRGHQDLSLPLGSSASAGLQASWELDLFGGNAAARDAAQNRLTGAQASWHEARVSVAAEVAGAYVGLRACEAQLAQTQLDASSRAETARLTELASKAGFQTPATAALARASAAQGNSLLTQQRAQCDLNVKALVALTSLAEPALLSQLAGASAQLPQPAQIAVNSVPAEALAQRPDLFNAAREVLAASADLSQAQARRYPRIVLSGSIAAARFSSAAGTLDDTLWSLGPVSVSLPLFDGGARRANVEAARARYQEARANYAARLRGAVREVEEALITLQSTAARSSDAQVASEGFAVSYRATDARFRGGLTSLFELEDARRSVVQANSALIELQRERVAAWIALYRSLGGGWVADAPTTALAASQN